MANKKTYQDHQTELEKAKKLLAEKEQLLNIEISLERVRSSALSMSSSKDLSQTIGILFEELESLGLKTIRCGIGIFDDDSRKVNVWSASVGDGNTVANLSGDEYLEGHPLLDSIYKHWKLQKDFSYTLESEDLRTYYKHVSKTNHPVSPPKNIKKNQAQYYHAVMFPAGGLFAFKETPFDNESISLMKRFTNVFHFAFIRHRDLIKAESQAREAQIEAALERVRSRSMAMQNSSELLDVVSILFEQLQNIGIDLIHTGATAINLFIAESRDMEVYVCASHKDGLIIQKFFQPYFENPVCHDMYETRLKQPELFMASYNKKIKDDFYNSLFKLTGLGDLSKKEKKEILDKPKLDMTIVPSEHFMINIMDLVNEKLSDFQIDVFKRFIKVFEQSYIRFLDLKKAEEQARTAEINLAVERVRAKAMAMHKSEEIIDLVAKLKYEIMSLDIPDIVAATILLKEANDQVRMWDLSSLELDDDLNEVPFDITFKLKQNDPDLYVKKVWENKEDYFVVIQEEKGFNRLMEWLREHGKSEVAEEVEDYMEKTQLKRLYHTAKKLNYGKLVIDLLHPPSNEMKSILTKMGDAFDLAYTRFLDLKNAEAQTRKAQIETSLERVRSRSLAMNDSDELNDVLSVLFKQFDVLEIRPVTAFLSLFDIKNNTFTYRSTGKAGTRMQTQQVVDLNSLDVWKDLVKKWQNDKVDSIEEIHYPKELLPDLFNLFDETFSAMPKEDRVSAEDFPDGGYAVHGYCKFGYLGFNHTRKATEEEKEILRLFSNEFSRVYQRFLDIKKAEAQAREAQIEAALERVRSRTMGMQHSDELKETATLMFDQIKSLDIDIMACGFNIWNEDKSKATAWMAGMNRIQPPFQTDSSKDIFKRIYQAEKDGNDFFVEEQSAKDLKEHYKYMASIPTFAKIIEQLELAGGSLPDFQIVHCAYFNYGYLMFITLEHVREAHSIFKRFGKVFEQTYTRFLDLQKAEAQAREAQIEAALERVRSRSMSMHKSDELLDVATILFEELSKLEIFITEGGAATISLYTSDPDIMNAFVCGSSNLGLVIENFVLKRSDDKIISDLFNCKNLNSDVFIGTYNKSEKNNFYQLLFDNSELKNIPKEIKNQLLDAESLTMNVISNEYFTMNIIDLEQNPLKDNEIDILKRFSEVFKQSYTRFIDLKKAEKQAREAQIEAALERVRSKTMIMQHSEEIAGIVGQIFSELGKLDLVLNRVLIWIFNDEEKHIDWWSANPESDYNSKSYRVDYNQTTVFLNYLKAWKKRLPIYQYLLSGEKKRKWEDYLFGQTELSQIPEEVKKGMQEEGRIHTTSIMSDYGLMMVGSYEPLSEENTTIIQRFGTVFQQSYTRYLDVQKAEAQAREAQIETALERVRSRTMGMQKSEELSEVAKVLFEQFSTLGRLPDRMSIGIIDEDIRSIQWWVTDQSGFGLKHSFTSPFKENKTIDSLYSAWKKGNASMSIELKGKDLKNWLDYVTKEVKLNIDDSQIKGKRVHQAAFFSKGLLLISTHEAVAPEIIEILKRFAKVFNQTYTRFLDLQRVEEQAKEAKIEASLERVRATAMAMHSTDDLLNVIKVISNQLMELKIPLNNVSFGTNILEEKSNFWLAAIGMEHPIYMSVPYIDNPAPNRVRQAQKDNIDFFADSLTVKENKSWLHHIFKHTDVKLLSEEDKEIITNCTYTRSSFILNNINLYVGNYFGWTYTDEENNILRRFAKAFEQAYTRFLDLQKAEEQAREAQIEAALERVRSRSIGMQSSDELSDLSLELVKQVQNLGISTWFCAFNIYSKDGKTSLEWGSNGEGVFPRYNTPREGVFLKYYKAGQKGQDLLINEIDEDKCPAHYEYLCSLPGVGDQLLKMKEEGIPFPTYQIDHVAFFKYGYIIFITYEPVPESHDVFKRFAKVFEQTYRRFLDLQKAEDQARESQIEAALERVRSRSMAMHKSEELLDVISVVSEQLQQLDFKFNHVSFAINSLDEKYNFWVSAKDSSKPMLFKVPIADLAVFNSIRTAQKQSASFLTDVISRIDHKNWHKHLLKHVGSGVFSKETNEYIMSRGMARSVAINPNVMLIIANYASTPYSEDQNKIIARFGRVFEQSYTRFLDLQKAEEQARESQIEAALERVRSKAIAMRSSADIGEAITILFEEIEKLGIESLRVGIGIIHNIKSMEAWTTTTTKGKNIVQITGQLDMTIHPVLTKVFNSWKNNDSYISYKLEGQELQSYYKAMSNKTYSLPNYKEYKKTHFLNGFFFKKGAVYVFTKQELELEDIDIIKRFTKVFGLTYQRYRELIDSEIREREAKKQASLDRVRGEIASMRSTEDLNRITPIIWQELTNLGVPFFRCGVFIMNENNKNIQVFLSDPNGKSLGLMNLDYKTNELTQNSVKAWRKSTVYKAHWNKDEFIDWTNTLIELGKIKTPKGYQGGDEAPDSLDLHFVPFKQGMLYVGNLKPLNDDHLSLVSNIADSFSIAYSRYEDFDKLEKAKEKVENALRDLKATQKQLIQSEKMASLGELTAGIAHEIQNPLNFVNNFSEVSSELLDEIEEELQNGDITEVRSILTDIKENLLKINHHGKRADGIVKGMLLHSRESSGEKESIDLNELVDEYLRLAYHGFRAKDKSFNSELITDYQEDLKKINIVQQDIGRVVLNIITNSFHTVTEKKESLIDDSTTNYNPTVSVKTYEKNKSIFIEIKDNGKGIPESIIDKIFQPFFTTKPTGQGTGLGLSIGYDIIKAHGGEMKVETIENEGTTFIINLPY